MNTPFSSVAREPSLVEKVASELTDAIVSGQLARGDRLPSERDLGDQFGVSRTVIREAVRALVARGLVTVTSGRGAEIAGVDARAVVSSLRLFIRGTRAFDYRQIHEVRKTIEVQTAGLAAERATAQDVATLEQLCAEHALLIEESDYLGASRVDFEFHRALVSATGNEMFLIMLDSVQDVLREVRERTYPEPGVGEAGLKEHRLILRRVVEGDVAGARKAMAQHLNQAESVWLTGDQPQGTESIA